MSVDSTFAQGLLEKWGHSIDNIRAVRADYAWVSVETACSEDELLKHPLLEMTYHDIANSLRDSSLTAIGCKLVSLYHHVRSTNRMLNVSTLYELSASRGKATAIEETVVWADGDKTWEIHRLQNSVVDADKSRQAVFSPEMFYSHAFGFSADGSMSRCRLIDKFCGHVLNTERIHDGVCRILTTKLSPEGTHEDSAELFENSGMPREVRSRSLESVSCFVIRAPQYHIAGDAWYPLRGLVYVCRDDICPTLTTCIVDPKSLQINAAIAEHEFAYNEHNPFLRAA